MRADAALTHAMHSIARARYQLHNGGYLRDGADPTIIAAVLHAAARSMTLSPQWADVVRPPLGRHAPGFPILHRTQNEAA